MRHLRKKKAHCWTRLHEKADEEGSAMATYQAMIALEAVQKLRTEKKWIFDFK